MQVQINGWVYLDTIASRYSKEPQFTFFRGARDTSLGGGVYVPLVEATVTADVPEFDSRALQVAALRKRAKSVQAEAQATLTQIEREIGKLLAIEHAEAA